MLAQLSSFLLDDMMRKVRRRAIAGVVIAASVLAAAIEGTSAARHALEPWAGPVGARLILVGVFVLIAAGAVGWLAWGEGRSSRRDAGRDARGDEDPRAAIIAEAVSVGYSLGRDFMKASPNGHAVAAEEAAQAQAQVQADAEAEAAALEAEAAAAEVLRQEAELRRREASARQST